MNTLQRFLTNTVNACIPKREYTPEQVIKKLESEISTLWEFIKSNDPTTTTWKEKHRAMQDKIQNLMEIKSENNNVQILNTNSGSACN